MTREEFNIFSESVRGKLLAIAGRYFRCAVVPMGRGQGGVSFALSKSKINDFYGHQTTNLPFTRWEEIFKDKVVLCSALVDRLFRMD